MIFFSQWLLLAAVQAAATMSPGPAFAMSVRQSMRYGRQAGLYTAIGLGAGVGLHIIFVLCGIAILIEQSPFLYAAIKYSGAAYLIYIGMKGIIPLFKKRDDAPYKNKAITDILKDDPESSRQSTDNGDGILLTPYKSCNRFKAFKSGVFTNLLNPKAVVFFTAIFAQFISLDTPIYILTLYGLTSVFIEITWFMFVVYILTHQKAQQNFVRVMRWIEGVCGGLLIFMGLRLAVSKGIMP